MHASVIFVLGTSHKNLKLTAQCCVLPTTAARAPRYRTLKWVSVLGPVDALNRYRPCVPAVVATQVWRWVDRGGGSRGRQLRVTHGRIGDDAELFGIV